MEQNKTRSYILYALGEILLVVIGILIALQINNWNQERQNRNREQVILQDLHQEFLKNRDQLNLVIAGHQVSLKSSTWLLDHFDHLLNEEQQDSVIYHLKAMMSAWTFNPSQSGVQALINTSSFELIQDYELRQRLLLWTDQYKDYAEEEESAKFAFENFLLRYIQTHGDIRIFSPLANAPEDPDLEPYTGLPFRNLLEMRKFELSSIVNSNEGELDLMRDNLDSIIKLTAPK